MIFIGSLKQCSNHNRNFQSGSLTSRGSEDEYTAPSLSGLDSISFGALAAAQASLTQSPSATTTAITPTSHKSTRQHQRAPASISSSSQPPVAHSLKRKRGSDTNHSQPEPRRPSKHAPATMSSTKPVSRRRIVVSGSEPVSNSNIPGFGLISGSLADLSPAVTDSINQDGNHHLHHGTIGKARDPRFTPLSGTAPAPATLHRRYAFLDEYRAAEAEALRNIINTDKNRSNSNRRSNRSRSSRDEKKEKGDAAAAATAAVTAVRGTVSEETRAAASAALQKHTALAQNRERALARQELVRAHRRQERELLKKGRKGKAWFLKRSVLRERAGAAAVNGSGSGSGSGSGVTGINVRKESGIASGKANGVDTNRTGGDAPLQNKKREARREKKLMRKEKSFMGQRRRT